jgi:hypothetical protein
MWVREISPQWFWCFILLLDPVLDRSLRSKLTEIQKSPNFSKMKEWLCLRPWLQTTTMKNIEQISSMRR